MCFGEATNDTLDGHEQAVIADMAARSFRTHALSLHSNADGITWATLTPRATLPALLRFTICRIDPCVMVLIEDHDARRQIRSLSSLADALDFVRDVSDQALLATTDGGRRSQ